MAHRLTRALATLALVTATGGASAPVQAAIPHRPIVVIDANKSNNWSGYNQGALEKGTTFNSITGDWVVPTATQRVSGRGEYSSTWIGIGGGCIDANCNVTDGTLIQAGTEQDVAANGAASYSAWFELIPAPGLTITSLAVRPGDRFHASIAEVAANSNVWTITLQNVTTGQSWSQTVPYSSTHATAEWILETPIVIGGGGTGLSSMPNLSTTNFDLATVNGHPAGLTAAEAMQLVASNGSAVATPSAPDSDTDGFNVCTYASSCGAPAS
jgi:hypothetical protein